MLSELIRTSEIESKEEDGLYEEGRIGEDNIVSFPPITQPLLSKSQGKSNQDV
jgi:hypothetical protein